MKSSTRSVTSPFAFVVVLVMACLMASSTMAFTPSSWSSSSAAVSSSRLSRTQLFFFGQPKDDGSPGDYKCPDCDYVFTKGPKAWAELPDSWSCPPCGAPKRRFKKVPKGSAAPPKTETKKKGFFGK